MLPRKWLLFQKRTSKNVFELYRIEWVEEKIHTWLENRQTSISVSKHQFALFGGVPSE